MQSKDKLSLVDTCGIAMGGMVGGDIFAVLGEAVIAFGNLEQITSISSLVFLFVFSIGNFMGYMHNTFKGWKKIVPIIESTGCASAMVILLYETYHSNPATVYIVIGISVSFAPVSRGVYLATSQIQSARNLNF